VILFLLLDVIGTLISIAYAALLNARPTRLRQMLEEGQEDARGALDLIDNATALIVTIQLLRVLILFASAAVTAVVLIPQINALFMDLGASAAAAGAIAWGSVLIFGTFLFLMLYEFLPNAIAGGSPEELALRVSGLMTVLMRLFYPIARLMLWISDKLAKPFGGSGDTPMVTEEEIMTMVDAGQEEGVIEDGEKEMIYSIFEFGDKVCREVMVPRIDIMALEIHTPIEQALAKIIGAGHSRIPVYEGDIDDIRGLLYAKDLLALWKQDEPIADANLEPFLRPAYFVPESKRAVELLQEIQRRKIHIAVVVDEYGGTAGIVTIEDLLEEIVGEIQDEYDFDEEAPYEQVADNVYIVDGSMDLHDLNRLLDVALPAEMMTDTLGGYIFSQLSTVPQAGETFNDNGLEFEVLNVSGRRIKKVKVTVLEPRGSDEAESENGTRFNMRNGLHLL
jgi:CBS domain containing-hemolysin-like protein